MKNVLLCCLCCLLAACGKRSPVPRPVDDVISEGLLLRGNSAEPESIDPHLATSVSAGNVLINLFEGLVRLNAETLEPEPGVAESWEVSEDGLTIDFHLRSSQWSNGKPVTASDFAFAFRRLLNPALGASYAFMLFPLENARAVHAGELPMDALGVEVIDEQTLRLRLEEPTPYIFALLAHWTAFPLPEELLVKLGNEAGRGGEWTRSENLVVNGPFMIEDWRPEDRMLFIRNPYYWQSEEVALNGAVYLFISDTGTEEKAFRAGEIHVTYTLPRHRLRHYQEEGSDVLRVDPYLESVGYAVNVQHEALKDVRVRKALSLALNRKQLTDAVLYGVREPAYSYVPPGTAGYEPAVLLEENIAEAQQLLADAGYPEGQGFPEVVFIYQTAQDSQRVAEVIQQQWQQVLGIRIEIENLERQTYYSRRRERDFDLCYFGWVGDYVDPMTFLGLWESDAGNNLAGWKNEAYDAQLQSAAMAGDERMSALADAEAILLDEVPVLPLYFGATQYLIDPRVKGWYANRLDWHPLRAVYFE
ncbi:peptide ABC transporter substrate-binding protein [Kiritimatiellota bacterium B12222]|nr:peptide ABC transporter substrate-binding protein [Kiritimatiellota bacterium B12222]